MILGLAFGPLLALIGIACIPLLVCSGYIRLRLVVMKDQKNKRVYSKTAHMASEAAGAIKTVASLTREDECCREYHNALEGPTTHSIRSAMTSNILYAISQSLSFWVIGLVFYVGSRWLASGRYNTQQFFTVLNSVVFSAIQAGNVFSFVPDASKAKQSCTTIIKAVDNVPEIDAVSTTGKQLRREEVRGDIAFQNIHFRYPTRPSVRVLRGLDLKIPAGTSVALCGASGCGKSTTIGLVERFYDPLSGSVTLDGVPLDELNVESFRSQMALVSQEPSLYRGSIKFNIL
jgi:ATP-binding cassette subfamily B (MDR/TAP) protein 1